MEAAKADRMAASAPPTRPRSARSAPPHNAGHAVAQKKERGRSENLDPEIEA